MKRMTLSRVIVSLFIFLELKMAKKIRPRSAKIRNGFSLGYASGIPIIRSKIKGTPIIMPGIKMNE
jgi:hypothetical protein